MWTKKTTLAALLSIARFWPGVEAKHIRRELTSKSAKTAKTVCLEFGFEIDVVVAGSATPIAGPTSLTPACLGDGGLCLADFTAGGDYNSDGCQQYLECLGENGPSFVGSWWFNRDVPTDVSFAFKESQVCASVLSDALNTKTSMELWDQDVLGQPLERFRDFKVNYEIVNPGAGGSVAFVNFYVRAQPGRGIFYDCNFVFLAPVTTAGAQDVIFFDRDTPSSSARKCTAGYCTPPGPIDNGCVDGNSINDYLAANPTAVFGVGNKEWYSFVLTNGSSNQDNKNLEVCWSDVLFTRVDEDGMKIINTYEFTSLN